MPLRMRVELSGEGVVGGGISTTYWRTISPEPQATELDGIQEAVRVFWSTISAQTTDVMAGGTTVTFNGEFEDVDLVTGQVTSVHTRAGWSHTANTADIAPKATQGLINVRTGHFVQGRELRGRMFIPSINKIAVDGNGSLTAAGRTTLNEGAEVLPVASDGEDYWMVVYSPTHATEAPVTALVPSSKFAVLRSRRD